MSKAEDNIVIKNIYYMMAYAFRSLSLKEYSKLAVEDFDHIEDLLAAILTIGISTQRKRGFERDYLEIQENLLSVRGHINIQNTARNKISQHHEISCEYDEYLEDTYKNRILKCCAEILLKSPTVESARKKDLKRCLQDLSGVSSINPKQIQWNSFRFHRNNRSYQLLMNICHMIIESWLFSEASEEVKLPRYLQGEKLYALYENFVFAYFKEEHRELTVTRKHISSGSDNAPSFLPTLCTDVTLEYKNNTLIIDCKCYGKILQSNMDHEILSSAHRNQIYGYVMHEAYDQPKKNVEGMLLYALTQNEKAKHESWVETGHGFHCFTLDLSLDFKEIANQLDEIAQMVTI